jgi:hypothetical protein
MALFATACACFFADLSDRLAGNRVGKAALHDLLGQEPERPARLPLRRWGASHGKHVRFLFARQLALGARPRLLVQRPQTGLDKPLASTGDGRRPHIQRGGNLGIAQPGIGV